MYRYKGNTSLIANHTPSSHSLLIAQTTSTGYQRVYLSLGKVADTPFHIQEDDYAPFFPAELSHLNFTHWKVVVDHVTQVGENYSYMYLPFNETKHLQIFMFR